MVDFNLPVLGNLVTHPENERMEPQKREPFQKDMNHLPLIFRGYACFKGNIQNQLEKKNNNNQGVGNLHVATQFSVQLLFRTVTQNSPPEKCHFKGLSPYTMAKLLWKCAKRHGHDHQASQMTLRLCWGQFFASRN